VLGGMVENHFVTTMIRSDGDLLAFFYRPIAAGLGILTLTIWLVPILAWARRKLRRAGTA
jgi:putative tricarboxylic transport membrane protein